MATTTLPPPESPVDLSGDPRRHRRERAMGVIFFAAAGLSLVISALILLSLFSNGLEFFTDVDWGNVFGASGWNPRQSQFGISTILAGSLIVTGIAMLVATPLGLGAAVYLSEYARPRVRTVLKPILEVLAGVPSVVFGVFALNWIAPEVVGRIFGEGAQHRQHDGGRHRRRVPHHPARRLGVGRRHAGGARQPARGFSRRRCPPHVDDPAGCVALGGVRHRGGIHPGGIPRHRRDHGGVHRRRRRRQSPASPPTRSTGSLTMTAAMASLAVGTENVRGAGLAVPSLYFVGSSCSSSPSPSTDRQPLRAPRTPGLLTVERATWRSPPFRPAVRPQSRASVVRGTHRASQSTSRAALFEVALLAVPARVAAHPRGTHLADPDRRLARLHRPGLGVPRRRPVAGRAERAGISQGLVGSFWIAVCVVVVSFPLGVGAAIYLEEYAPRNRLTSFIELNIRNLAGRAVGGLRPARSGHLRRCLQRVQLVHDGVDRRTLAAAGVTLAVLVLPIVIITTAEAIRAVPLALREGAYGVGATRWEVIRSQVLPYAAPGILTGALLSIARAVGEAARLILVGAADGALRPGRRASTSATSLDPGSLTERFMAMPIDHHHVGQAARRRVQGGQRIGHDHRHAGVRPGRQLDRHRPPQPVREEEVAMTDTRRGPRP